MTTAACVLLSGGLDSAAVLHRAKEDGARAFPPFAVRAIGIDYAQRHRGPELRAAEQIAKAAGIRYGMIPIAWPWARSGDVVIGRNLILLADPPSGGCFRLGFCERPKP